MKGHTEHNRKHRETGGVNEAEQDLRDKPEARTNAKKIDAAAEERKRGGRTGEEGRHHGDEHHHAACKCARCTGGRTERKRGGMVHHEKMENMKHAKHIGPVHGEAKHNAGRKARKSGGRTGADSHPFSSARYGESAPGHKVEKEFD